MVTSSSDDGTGSAVELTPEECRELLGTQTVGRVAFQGSDGPRIVPVNFRLGDEGVEFRTTSYSELATYAPGAAAAFEVDDLDPQNHAGWSVVVTGPCERMVDEPGVALPEPWAGGRRQLRLRVRLASVTGRRVGPSPAGHARHHPDAR